MNPRFYFPIAFLVSLTAHIILIACGLARPPIGQPDVHGVLQVIIKQNTDEQGRRQPLNAAAITSPTIRNPDQQNKLELEKPILFPTAVNFLQEVVVGTQASGNLNWQSQSPNKQEIVIYAMQKAQLMRQAELRKASVVAGLSNITLRLRPLVTGKIDCQQQPENEIKCIPEQNKATHALLKQFLTLAIEAHILGLPENPIILDYGLDSEVSLTLHP